MTGPTPAPGLVPSRGPHTGHVTAFDPKTGLGSVAEAGGVAFGFHATAITDGSRDIAVGTAVCFTVAPGHGGRYEADALTPTPAGEEASHQRPV
jgi:cold shock CspA family protein